MDRRKRSTGSARALEAMKVGKTQGARAARRAGTVNSPSGLCFAHGVHLNGVKIGGAGSFPPDFASGRDVGRRDRDAGIARELLVAHASLPETVLAAAELLLAIPVAWSLALLDAVRAGRPERDGQSVLPEGLLAPLKDQELRDLSAYLRVSQPVTP